MPSRMNSYSRQHDYYTPAFYHTYPSPSRKSANAIHERDSVSQESGDCTRKHSAGVEETDAQRQLLRWVPEAEMVQDTRIEAGLFES